jgi:hypothetical protein
LVIHSVITELVCGRNSWLLFTTHTYSLFLDLYQDEYTNTGKYLYSRISLEAKKGSQPMRRLYFLLPDLDTTKTVVDELLLARIEDRHIHIVAKEGTPLEDLPEASFQSDVGPAIERGVVLGGVTGVLAGLVAITFPPAGLVLGGGAVLALGVLGAGMGGFYSAMIGLDVEDRRIQKFDEAIANGEFLMLVDVPKKRVHEIEDLIKKHHPDADIEGTEPTIPAFP